MILSALWFSVMGVLVKLAGERLPTGEIVLARAVIALVISYVMLNRAGIHIWGHQKLLLTLRGIFGSLGLYCVFYALTHLPLAEATVIQYMHPIFTAVLAALLLGERISRRLMTAIGLSVLGVLAVSRPTFLFGGETTLDQTAVAVAVSGAFVSACAYILVRRLSVREHPLVIIFYFPLVSVPVTIPIVAADLVWPTAWEWALLLGVGVATQMGQIYLTRGLKLEPAGRATALSYLQVAFAAGWGMLVFSVVPGWWTVGGAMLILTGAYVNIRGGQRMAARVEKLAAEEEQPPQKDGESVGNRSGTGRASGG